MKKLACFCIVCMLISMISPVSYASNMNSMELNMTDATTEVDIEQYLQANIPSLLLSAEIIDTQNTYDLILVGNEIPTYIFTTSGSVATEYRCYPIWIDQTLAATIYVFGETEEDMCCQLVVSYADALENFLSSQPTSHFALVFDALGLNIVTESVIESIYCTTDKAEDRGLLSSSSSDLTSADMIAVSDVSTSLFSISTDSIRGLASTQSITTLNLSVPFVSQDDYDLCWAASMSSIGEYLTGKSYSITTIAGWAGMTTASSYDGLDGSYWVSYFNSHYSQSYAYYRGEILTYSTIYTNLNNGLPIYMVGRRVKDDNEYGYHGVVVRGVYYNSSTNTRTVSFMDPSYNSQQYVSVSISVSGTWYFASYNGNSYKQQSYAV